MLKHYLFLLCLLSAFSFYSCKDNSTSPEENTLGGDPNLSFTQPGCGVGFGMHIEGNTNPELYNIRDSIYVDKNENGIVTTKGTIRLTIDQYRIVDTLMGTYTLPVSLKLQYIDTYLKKFGATLDTSNMQDIKVGFQFVHKITSEGIQDFYHSKGDLSRPFTIVKYSSNVGDKYEFTNSEGKKITRTVISKAEKEDWDFGFFRIKTIKVEEVVQDDPLVEKIVYVANHKFGPVGVLVYYKSGKVVETGLMFMDKKD